MESWMSKFGGTRSSELHIVHAHKGHFKVILRSNEHLKFVQIQIQIISIIFNYCNRTILIWFILNSFIQIKTEGLPNFTVPLFDYT